MGRIYNRLIRKDQDSLLDSIWENIEHGDGDCGSDSPDSEDLEDLRSRIARATEKRSKRVRLLYAGVAAAAFLAVCFPIARIIQDPGNGTPTDRLKSMGVAVSEAQVSLIMDNDISLALSDSAEVRTCEGKEAYIVGSPGIEVEVGSGRILKLEVPSGKQFHLTLSDGTSVWLNSESVLEYPASFEGLRNRTVKLSGEAFFEVTRNEECPFIVELAEDGRIEVLGTSFNVNSYPENGCSITTLISGKIAYSMNDNENSIIIHPDQQIRAGAETGTAEVLNVETGATTDWKGGNITFDDEKLSVLARRLSRMYGIEIVVDSRVADYTFTGRISYDKGVDFITRLLEETSGIVCEIKDGKIILN